MNETNARVPYIPEYITVHLGTPSSNAENVTVPFYDYIKNVASSEIYPTWNEEAIRANVLAQISFALNRIYTEYYRSRGYGFDITNSTSVDQSYVNGRDIFDNISQTVDGLTGSYLSRRGDTEPLFASYCDGVEVTCGGLSQWGSERLAAEGQSTYDIIKYYYGDDVEIVTDAPTAGITESYPGVALRRGSSGNEVFFIQRRLNRISQNYPAIPYISPTNGFFTDATENAVKEFQRIFSLTADGIVGRATWYRIQQIYAAVRSLADLNSEGVPIEDVTNYFPTVLSLGDSGIGVSELQYLLSFVSEFVSYIPKVEIDGVFGVLTQNAVESFQTYYGMEPTGAVDTATWEKLLSVYRSTLASVPDGYFNGRELYFGTPLTLGDRGVYVERVQDYLNYLSTVYPSISPVVLDGVFGDATETAVKEFQELVGLDITGIVGSRTYSTLAKEYASLNQNREGGTLQ